MSQRYFQNTFKFVIFYPSSEKVNFKKMSYLRRYQLTLGTANFAMTLDFQDTFLKILFLMF